MKKLIIATAICLLLAGAAYAGTTQNCGCGLGTIIFSEQDGLVSQVSAATTNGIFGNQTFGITSGTLDCQRPTTFADNKLLNQFVSENMDNLAVDIAAGEGESLDTLADIIQMPREKRPRFYAELQNRFAEIYPDSDVTHQAVVMRIGDVVAQI